MTTTSSSCSASPSQSAGAEYVFRGEKLRSLAACSSPSHPAVLAICGSLNPIHNAHFELYSAAKAALEAEGEFTVMGGFFSPVGDAYGKPGLKTAAQRVKIIEDAVRDHAELNVDTWECVQPTYTRTLYVLQQLEQHVNAWYAQREPELARRLCTGGDRGVRVVLVCGADLFSSFWRPGCWPLHLLKQLLDTFPLAVVYRDLQGDVKSAADFARVCEASPVLAETVDGTLTEVDMRAYKFTFAQFTEPDDTSSTAVREVAAAMASIEPSDGAARDRLRARLCALVPASAVASVVAYYGHDGKGSVTV